MCCKQNSFTMIVGYDCVLSIQHLISTNIRNQEFPSSKLGPKTEAIGEILLSRKWQIPVTVLQIRPGSLRSTFFS